MTPGEAVAQEREAVREFVLSLARRDGPGIPWECPFLMRFLDERDGTTRGMDALTELWESRGGEGE